MLRSHLVFSGPLRLCGELLQEPRLAGDADGRQKDPYQAHGHIGEASLGVQRGTVAFSVGLCPEVGLTAAEDAEQDHQSGAMARRVG